MLECTIKIPRFVEGKEFYNTDLADALKDCQTSGYEAQFMPSIIDARIIALDNERILQKGYTTPSLKATGKTEQGNAVVVYAHIPNYFSNPDNIKEAKKQGLIRGAGMIPTKEFQKILSMEDNKTVFVIDYNNLKSSESGIIQLKNALKHPQTIPFIGGQERAEKYLEKHKKIYGEKIGIWHTDDLRDRPLGRLLFLGYYYSDGLGGDNNLYFSGRFVGVRAEGATQKISAPSLETIMKTLEKHIPEIARDNARKSLEHYYE